LAEAPLWWVQDRPIAAADLPDGTSRKFFRGDLDSTDRHGIVGEFRLSAHEISPRKPAASRHLTKNFA
jgi:hypothetical protein